jgi:hypothetical protein
MDKSRHSKPLSENLCKHLLAQVRSYYRSVTPFATAKRPTSAIPTSGNQAIMFPLSVALWYEDTIGEAQSQAEPQTPACPCHCIGSHLGNRSGDPSRTGKRYPSRHQ